MQSCEEEPIMEQPVVEQPPQPKPDELQYQLKIPVVR